MEKYFRGDIKKVAKLTYELGGINIGTHYEKINALLRENGDGTYTDVETNKTYIESIFVGKVEEKLQHINLGLCYVDSTVLREVDPQELKSVKQLVK